VVKGSDKRGTAGEESAREKIKAKCGRSCKITSKHPRQITKNIKASGHNPRGTENGF